MYFTPGPKEKIEDFYNYREQLKSLEDGIKKREKLIVIKGVRRVGKTSLMEVVYNRIKMPKVFIDARAINSRTELKYTLVKAANELLGYDVLKRVVKHVKNVSVGPISFELEKVEDFEDVFEKLDQRLENRKKHGVIFMDEAQRTSLYGGDSLLAYLYDNTSNLTFIISGSEVGILENFAGYSSEKPLYGRARRVIEMKRLDKDKAAEFLLAGFKEMNKKISREEIDEVIDTVDGVIGWLTLYGYYRKGFSHKKALNDVVSEAAKITADELRSFLKNKETAKSRYLIILQAVAEGRKKWGEIKGVLESRIGNKVSDGRFYAYLENLESYSFIEKIGEEYFLADPLIKKGAGLV
ncbi:MAG: ATP-binding protein [Candidatus Anstonellales archaeon]